MPARRLVSVLVVALVAGSLAGGACQGAEDADSADELGWVESRLTASQRRTRAGQIRDAAFANGLTQGWLLAGIADAETNMSHCWSELTWACQGPDSADCGGGPVVAGAGDGACSLEQGGLGMFQFDAGTFDDTLAREGERILSIAGNVAAAVDFVTAMVIRSAYIDGVSTEAEAIEWMNGVRVGNERWDPWVSTVTHYYNGCAPSYSCWSSRYAHYRDNTSGVYDEMGADFWVVGHVYAASFVAQTFPYASDDFPLTAGSSFTGSITLRNEGSATWTPGRTFLATTEPRDGASALAGPDWIASNRPATVDAAVAPGGTGTFTFTVVAPATPGDYPQYFNLVEEGVAWFSDDGGPVDAQLQVRVTSVASPSTCPSGLGTAWTCDGADRVRCVDGAVLRETCGACVPDGASGEASCDVDGDGYGADDCDEARVEVNPGALEVCEDGIDQDCSGIDAVCGEDGEPVEDGSGGADAPRYAGRSARRAAGCSASPGGASRPSASAASMLLLASLACVVARRRRR